jgi:hypothetical protein
VLAFHGVFGYCQPCPGILPAKSIEGGFARDYAHD